MHRDSSDIGPSSTVAQDFVGQADSLTDALHQGPRTFLVHNRNIIAGLYAKTLLDQGHKVVVIESEADKGAPYVSMRDNPNLTVVPLTQPGEQVGSLVAEWINPNRILDIMQNNGVTDVVLGYGFFSENAAFAGYCRELGYKFHGPSPEILNLLGSKYESKVAARDSGLDVGRFSDLLTAEDQAVAEANRVGYPIMMKAVQGGGGRGQVRCENDDDVKRAFATLPSQAQAFFGSDEVFLEQFVKADDDAHIHHIEVQFARDKNGETWFSPRECSLQLNRQKVLEMTADFVRLMKPQWAKEGISAAEMTGRAHAFETDVFTQTEKLINKLGYVGIGTAEFLFNTKTGKFSFMEVNPRIQVEHGVTEESESTRGQRLNLKQLQLDLTDGVSLRDHPVCLRQIAYRQDHQGQFPVSDRQFSIQARINAVDIPVGRAAVGVVQKMVVPQGSGIRVDSGVSEGSVSTGQLDPHIMNIISTAATFDEAQLQLSEAFEQTSITGLTTNIGLLQRIVYGKELETANYDISYLDANVRTLGAADPLEGLARFLAFRTVNPEGQPLPAKSMQLQLEQPVFDEAEQEAFLEKTMQAKREFMRAIRIRAMEAPSGALPVGVIDTTLRDAHQSEFAARMLPSTLMGAYPLYNRMFNGDPEQAGLMAAEVWGGALFDTLMRFSHTNSYDYLKTAATLMPEVPLQALGRGANVFGYASQPDNVVEWTMKLSAKNGLDKIRIFDALNNPKNAEVAIKAALEAKMYVAAAISYVDDQPVSYFVGVAQAYKKLGVHHIDIKDMSGVGDPEHVAAIITAIKKETGLLVGYHTHDTSGWAAATIHAAIKAGVDFIDLAADSMGSGSSQPRLGAFLRMERNSGRIPPHVEIMTSVADEISQHFGEELEEYASRYADKGAKIASLVKELAMPGGQISNLIAQAKGVGLTTAEEIEAVFARYKEIRTYIASPSGKPPLVTPTSKGAGDEAITATTYAKAQGRMTAMTYAEILDRQDYRPAEDFRKLIRGDMGLPPAAHQFPDQVARTILLRTEDDKAKVAAENAKRPGKYDATGRLTDRPGAFLANINLEDNLRALQKAVGRKVSETEHNLSVLFPDVFRVFDKALAQFGKLPGLLPPAAYFGGLVKGQKLSVNQTKYKLGFAANNNKPTVDPQDKNVLGAIQLLDVSDVDASGNRVVTMDVAGRVQTFPVPDQKWIKDNRMAKSADRLDFEPGLQTQVTPGMNGNLQMIAEHGRFVKKGEPIAKVEAMKMENTIVAPVDGYINRLTVLKGEDSEQKIVTPGSMVGAASVLAFLQANPPEPLPDGLDASANATSNVVNIQERRVAMAGMRTTSSPRHDRTARAVHGS